MSISTAAAAPSNHEEQSRQAIIGAAKTISGKSHDVLDAEGRVITTTTAITDLEERNPDLLKVPSSEVMKFIVFLFGLFSVYCLDVLLFGSTAEYVVSLITGNWLLVLVAKYGVPVFFLGIEVLCSLKMIEARTEANEEVPTYGW
jgi:hypothetical protein